MSEFLKPQKVDKLWASLGDKTPPPDDTKIATGFIIEIPTIEQFNYIEWKQDSMLAHINQRGIPEWDTFSEYTGLKSYAQGSNGRLYFCKQTHTGINPVTDTNQTYWKPAFHFAEDVYTKSEVNVSFMQKSANLADLTNTNTARANLGVFSTGESTAYFMQKSANLSDLTNTNTARANLGVFSTGESIAYFTQKSANLTDLANKPYAFEVIKQNAAEGFAGVIPIASAGEVNAGIVDSKAVTPAKMRLGFSASFGGFGHVSFPTWLGGLIIQWGWQNIGANAQIPAQLSRPFPNACLVGIVSWASNTFTDQYAPKGFTSGTNFYINNTNAAADAVHWLAIGV